jgi:hypothetical protein
LNNITVLDNVGIHGRTINDGIESILASCESCVECRNFGSNVGVIAKENNTVSC